MSDGLLLSDEELGELTEVERGEYLAILEDERTATAHLAWREKARPEQLPPEDDWQTLFLRGGRGSGKGWAASHILAELIASDPLRDLEGPGSWALVAPTYGDARDVGVESESGLLAAFGTTAQEVAAGQSPRVELWNRSMGSVRLRDGSVVFLDGADDGALRIQGRNLRGAWLDEVGLWKQWEKAFDESLTYALRKGAARLVVSATPKSDMPARALVRRLLGDPVVVKRRLRTLDNAANLSAAFIEDAKLRAGTRLGRQELEGDLLEDVDGALWRRSELEEGRVDHPPALRRVVVALDPADGTAQGDEQAICAAGLGEDGHIYVLRSDGVRTTPLEWLKRAVRLARELDSTLVIEKNFGGRFIVGLLEQAMEELGVRAPYRMIDAHGGKKVRAEPVSTLFEVGRAHLVGVHDVLEEQLVSFTGMGGKSPDRLDSMCHAVRELMGYRGSVGGGHAAVPYSSDPVPGGAVPWR